MDNREQISAETIEQPTSIRLRNQRVTRRFIIAAMWSAILIPALFYLQFGVIDSYAIGFTIFMMAFCLLTAAGFYLVDKDKYHTPISAKGDWLDKIGAGWLMACGFGPFIGFLITTAALPVTVNDWWWRYGLRVFFSIALPVLTALPLLRYVRGQGKLIMILILAGVTALPVWAGLNTLLDLYQGPVIEQRSIYVPVNTDKVIQAHSHNARLTTLRHTQRVIKIETLPE